MSDKVRFIKTTHNKFETKYNSGSADLNALYFLTSGQLYLGTELISNVHIVDWFPTESDALEGNYYISATTGEMRFMTDGEYTDISDLFFNNVVLNSTNLEKIINEIADVKKITMPTLHASGEVLVWQGSNVDDIDVLIPKV